MPPDAEGFDAALVADVRGWLSKANKDLAAADCEMKGDATFASDILFHSQQAAEKSLKAFLCRHRVPFRKTHNLLELGEACCQINPSLEAQLRQAGPLSEYAWKVRYPDDPEEPVEREATIALMIAHRVFEAIISRIPVWSPGGWKSRGPARAAV